MSQLHQYTTQSKFKMFVYVNSTQIYKQTKFLGKERGIIIDILFHIDMTTKTKKIDEENE